MVNQKLICALLDKFGLTYYLANDGLEALTAFENKQFDLILMDQNMPNMSGTQACQHIREREKNLKLKHTPIIALTANAMEGDREFFLSSGMDEYLTKPIKVDSLQKIFSQFLNNH